MFALDDTIVACATAAGRGGIAVVRISGPSATTVASVLIDREQPLEPRRATFSRLRFQPGSAGDEVVTTLFPGPRSYTGQDVVEISAHGSPVIVNGIVRAAVSAGARLARPGEFTLRAFLNGKRDLIQAEAVADLVEAATPLQVRVACDQLEGTLTRAIRAVDEPLFDLIARLEASLDFPDEGYHFVTPLEVEQRISELRVRVDSLLGDSAHGRLIREGATVVIAGRTNVGKSSVFNALVGVDRAIVTSVAGTTRDMVSERVDMDGVPVTLVDTAGTRDTDDPVEQQGVARGVLARRAADAVVVVLDASEPLMAEDVRVLEETGRSPRVVVLNKRDCPTWSASQRREEQEWDGGFVELSATTGQGLADLRRAVLRALVGERDSLRDTAAVTNARHVELLRRARTHLAAAAASAAESAPEEFVLIELQAARQCFDEVIGTRTPDDVLQEIFGRFCIGK